MLENPPPLRGNYASFLAYDIVLLQQSITLLGLAKIEISILKDEGKIKRFKLMRCSLIQSSLVIYISQLELGGNTFVPAEWAWETIRLSFFSISKIAMKWHNLQNVQSSMDSREPTCKSYCTAFYSAIPLATRVFFCYVIGSLRMT